MNLRKLKRVKLVKAPLSRILLISFSIMFFSISTFAQLKKQISFNQDPVNEVFSKLEKEFKVRFYYSDKTIDTREKVSMALKTSSLNEVLDYLKINYAFEFKTTGNMIAVSKKQKETTSGNPLNKATVEIRGKAGLDRKSVV